MALNIYNIKKWYLMLTGKSVLHVNQDIGKCFEPGKIGGYYNNMTEKVTKMPELLEGDGLPVLKTESGETVVFPVGVFQYGLGAYDLFIMTGDEKYLKKFKQCVQWALDNQEENGAWNNFFYIYKDNPYGAMCQGEGASLLIRAYKETNENVYLDAAKKAVRFMLLDVKEGGTASGGDNGMVLLEYTHMPAVMNGWIFALFGLYDLNIVFPNEKNTAAYCNTVNTLIKYLPRFDCAYWSMYDLSGKIASPFYHNLHIAQMQALARLTGEKIFEDYAEKWEKAEKSGIKKTRAFIKKAAQKIIE